MDLQRQSIETTGQVLLFSFREREATLILNTLFSPELRELWSKVKCFLRISLLLLAILYSSSGNDFFLHLLFIPICIPSVATANIFHFPPSDERVEQFRGAVNAGEGRTPALVIPSPSPLPSYSYMPCVSRKEIILKKLNPVIWSHGESSQLWIYFPSLSL